jgi:hypothetical protein
MLTIRGLGEEAERVLDLLVQEITLGVVAEVAEVVLVMQVVLAMLDWQQLHQQ